MTTARTLTANERLKRSFWSRIWIGSLLSVLAHFAALRAMQFGRIPNYAVDAGASLEQIELEQIARADIPPPPRAIGRPAIPVLSTDVNISTDVTIAKMQFDEVPPVQIAPPPAAVASDLSTEPAFTPYEIRPTLLNGRDLQNALLASYPAAFKAAGIGGEAVLWIYIDEKGAVLNTRVVTSSGHRDLDAAAEG